MGSKLVIPSEGEVVTNNVPDLTNTNAIVTNVVSDTEYNKGIYVPRWYSRNLKTPVAASSGDVDLGAVVSSPDKGLSTTEVPWYATEESNVQVITPSKTIIEPTNSQVRLSNGAVLADPSWYVASTNVTTNASPFWVQYEWKIVNGSTDNPDYQMTWIGAAAGENEGVNFAQGSYQGSLDHWTANITTNISLHYSPDGEPVSPGGDPNIDYILVRVRATNDSMGLIDLDARTGEGVSFPTIQTLGPKAPVEEQPKRATFNFK